MIIVYMLVSWLVILGYWLFIVGVILCILMKWCVVFFVMVWLLIIYILLLVGIIVYFVVGEFYLGKCCVECVRVMWFFIVKWFNDFKVCKYIFVEENSSVVVLLFKFCECC